jgi:uncharacterized membrane protein
MRLLGHPIHPMLVHFPIVFWTVAAAAYVADAAGMGGEGAAAVVIAMYSNAAGLITAMLAMGAGLLELRSLEGRPMQVAIWHMMLMATAWICFVLALVLPISSGPRVDHSIASLAGVASAIFGFLLMGAGGWLGGRLVYEFGTGVKSRPESHAKLSR